MSLAISMKSIVSVFACMVLLLLPAALNAQDTTSGRKGRAASYADREGYAVLSELLAEWSKANGDRPINIYRLTVKPRDLDQCTKLPVDFLEAAADFKKKNEVEFALENKFLLGFRYKLVMEDPESSLDRTQIVNGKPKVTSALTSIYYISAVGFDRHKTRAIAYVKFFCGELCGQDNFYFLLKGKNGWEQASGV